MNHKDLAQQAFLKYENIFKKGKLLDAGCCNHSFKEWFEHLGFEWHGCDLNPQTANIIKCDMAQMPYENEFFNVVFACHSLEHVENPAAVLREFHRVLKPDGIVFIAMPLVCEKHILRGDFDHISILNPMQMQRLAIYTKFAGMIDFITHNEAMGHDFDNQNYIIRKFICN